MTTTLYRRNGTWYAKWQEGGKERRRSLKTTDKREAKRLKDANDKRLYRIEMGVEEEAKFNRLSPADALVHHEQLSQKKATTLANDRQAWNRFFSWHETNDIHKVKRHHVLEWRNALLAEGVSETSVNSYCRWLSAVFSGLADAELYTGSNPFKGLRALQTNKEFKFVPWDQACKLLDAAEEHSRDLHLAVALCALAGLRKGEVLDAKWGDIDWDAAALHVRGTKTKSSDANVSIHPRLREILERYRGKDDAYIVKPANGQGVYRYRWNWDRSWNTIEKRCGVECSPHGLRHSFATHLLDVGLTLAQIAKCLRHAGLSTVQQYAKVAGVSVDLASVEL